MNQPASITTLAELRKAAPATETLPAVRMGFETTAGFELMQRGAKLLAASSMVPQQYQGNVPNACIALNMASRMGMDPLMAMQNLYVVHGRPGWSSQFLIATWNQCGRYTSLRYEFTGKENTDEWGCRAWSIEKETGERLTGPLVTIGMAKAEGWSTKNGSKWKTMPELMLTYRAAAFMVRTYAPELAMGLQTREELQDVIDLEPDADGVLTMRADQVADATVATHEKPAPEGVTDLESSAPEVDRDAQVTYAQIAHALQKAKDGETLDVAADLIGSVADEQQRAELTALYQERRAKLAQ